MLRRFRIEQNHIDIVVKIWRGRVWFRMRSVTEASHFNQCSAIEVKANPVSDSSGIPADQRVKPRVPYALPRKLARQIFVAMKHDRDSLRSKGSVNLSFPSVSFFLQ